MRITGLTMDQSVAAISWTQQGARRTSVLARWRRSPPRMNDDSRRPVSDTAAVHIAGWFRFVVIACVFDPPNVRLQPRRLIITPAAVGRKPCWAVCRLVGSEWSERSPFRVAKPVRQCTGCTRLRSNSVDCQFEMTPLSPHRGHCHVVRSSAHTWCSMTPWR